MDEDTKRATYLKALNDSPDNRQARAHVQRPREEATGNFQLPAQNSNITWPRAAWRTCILHLNLTYR